MSHAMKKIGSQFVSIVLLLSLLLPVYPGTAGAADAAIVADDFTGYAPGGAIGSQNNWSYAGQPNEFIALQDSVTGNVYASGTYPNGTRTSYIGQRFAVQSGGMVMTFDLSLPQAKAAQLFVMEGSISNTGKRAGRIYLDNGTISVEGSGGSIAADPTRWYRFHLVFDVPGKTYDVAVTDLRTGEPAGGWTDVPFTSGVNTISSFGFSMTRDGTILLDNVEVKQLDLALSSLKVSAPVYEPVLTPAFDPSFASYATDVPYAVRSMTVLPVASNPEGVRLKVNGEEAAGGEGIDVAIESDATAIDIAVESVAYPGLAKTYSIQVNRLEKAPNVNYAAAEGRDGKALIGWEETLDPAYQEARVYMVQADGTTLLVDTVPKGTTISTIEGLTNGQTYTFAVKGVYQYEGEAPAESTGVTVSATPTLLPARQMERLDRGLVAIPSEGGVFVSWRLLGTDPDNISFHLYRDGKKVNQAPITGGTNYFDPNGTMSSTYSLQALGGLKAGREERETEPVSVWGAEYLSVPLQKPEGGVTPSGAYEYRANDATVGDLDGDGRYEIVLKWDPTNSQDNSKSGFTGNTFVDAYKLDGTRLWRIDLGRNLRSGAHYSPIMVYDLDGDGKAEVTFKTADGTIDGTGAPIGDPAADYRNDGGYILEGPEYFTIFNGETGAALVTEPYDPPRGDVNSWGDGYGNRVDRFGAAIAYLDGERPSVVFQRGYYTRMVFSAYNWRDGQLTKVWTFDTNTPGNEAYFGQGNHQLSVADVDADGKDEIVTGPAAIDDNGTGLWSSGFGHGDAMHLGDLIPGRLGLELFAVQESTGAPFSSDMKDARTGRVLWGLPQIGIDVGRGLSADIDPRYEGAESWSVGGGWNSPSGTLFAADGSVIGSDIPSANFAIWWDGDLSRELLDHVWSDTPARVGVPKIDKWNTETNRLENVVTFSGTYSNNDTKGNPSLQADVLGDWREEVILRTEDSSALRIYSTTSPTERRIHTLMHDPIYRLAIAWQNTGYNQPPHPSFYLGTGMTAPERPNIRLTGE